MNTLLPDADGEGWTEVGGAPPIDEDGRSAERLIAQLVHEGVAGDPAAGRRARCASWIEAPEDTRVRVRGEAVVELLVGDDAIARSAHALDRTLEPGQRLDLPAWQGATRLHAAEGQTVLCVASFSAASG
jgi:hypothetical protein